MGEAEMDRPGSARPAGAEATGGDQTVRGGDTGRRGMVDVMVIGAQKAGTSWLWEVLRRRDDVFSPPVKELHHYDHRHIPANRTWTRRHIRRGVRRALRRHVNRAAPFDRDWVNYLMDLADRDPFGADWYARAFARARPGMLRLDATPEYASLPPEGAAEAAADNPDLKVIHVLRAPVDRALSQIRMGFARNRVLAPTAQDWAEALASPDLADRSDYARHLEVWDATLPPDRILRLDFALLGTDPAAFLDRVEGFLDLPAAQRAAGFRDPVHVGPPIPAPDGVREALAERLAPQQAAMDRALGRAPGQGAADPGLLGDGAEGESAAARLLRAAARAALGREDLRRPGRRAS